MAIYLVNQSQTYRHERAGNYIWSPKLDKAGHRNRGYELMKEVRKGDYIIHNSGGYLSSISIAQEDYKSGVQPKELKTGQKIYEWDDDGWVVILKYYDFDRPLPTKEFVAWAVKNYYDDCAFQKNGKLKLQYLCSLAKPQAQYLLQRAFERQTDKEVLDVIQSALIELDPAQLNPEPRFDEEIADKLGLHSLRKMAEKRSSTTVNKESVATTQYLRDTYVSEYEKRMANGKCALCGRSAPFKDGNGKPYLETHHIIWLSKGGADSVENTVALCPNCHRKMHIVADPNDVERLKRVAKNNSL